MLAIKQSHIHTPAQSPKSTHNRHQNRSCAARGCGTDGWGGRGGWGARRSLEGVRGAPSAWISGGEAPPARSGRKSLRRSIPRQNLEAMPALAALKVTISNRSSPFHFTKDSPSNISQVRTQPTTNNLCHCLENHKGYCLRNSDKGECSCCSSSQDD